MTGPSSETTVFNISEPNSRKLVSLLNSPKKRRVVLAIAVMIGLIGITNLVIGALSLLAIDSMNVPGRALALRWTIDSIDPNLVITEQLQTQVANLKTTATAVLDVLLHYSGYLNVIPAYLILQGIVFLGVSIAIYFVIPKEEKRATGS